VAKHRNLVILDGPFSVEEVKLVEVDGSEVVVALCWVETDRPALGGRHRVVAYGPLARKVVTFTQAAGGGLVDATVDGWLRSDHELTAVVAERVSFHTSSEVVAQPGGG
jgi:hypothetical protein